MKNLLRLTIIIWLVLICFVIKIAAYDELLPPVDYLQAKLKQNDIVFLGTVHKKPEILGFIAELIPSLKDLEVTHIGLEIPSDQQERIDNYMQTGEGLDSIILHKQIDTPKYRHLFKVLLETGGPKPVAIDLPYNLHGGSVSRDEWMAKSILTMLPGKILVIVGNLHIFKKLEWEEQVPNQNLSVRQYIEQEKPNTMMWSVGQVIGEDPSACDFTQVFSHMPNAVALDLDYMVRGWKLGLASSIAIMPAESFELVDGLIVY